MTQLESVRITVLVVDDHPIVREGLRLLIETADDLQWVGEAANGREAISACQQIQPDVVLMDLRMPVLDGISAIEQILDPTGLSAAAKKPAVLILTTYNEEAELIRGLRAGARGCLLKDADRATLLSAVRTVAKGGSVVSPDLLEHLVRGHGVAPQVVQPLHDDLSPRELEVLVHAALGERSKEIAVALGISERTVKAHLAGAYNKLGTDSRTGAVAEAMRRGLLPAR